MEEMLPPDLATPTMPPHPAMPPPPPPEVVATQAEACTSAAQVISASKASA